MKTIGRYQIKEKIGFGGTALVYRAHDPDISRTLAIKVLREERCVDKEFRARFLRESKAAGMLSHPNIVTIYDIGEENKTPYIAMELLEGMTLEQFMKTGEDVSLSIILQWGIQLADALQYAHNHGIVHRDIKPGNIIIQPDLKSVTITDFGIAHLDEANITQHTQVGEVLGTPQYMSPEQVLGKTVDARSDLFSIGVILYQLLSKQKPFQADTLATLLFQIATENPEPIGQIAPELPGALKQTIDKLIRKKPEKRFQSGTELKRALQRILQDVNASDKPGNKTFTRSITFTWVFIMIVVMAMTLGFSTNYVYKQQNSTLNGQLIDYSSTLVKFIAADNAETVLSEDWANIELYVRDNMQQQNFEYLTIIDHNGIIRGSNNIELLNQIYVKHSEATHAQLHLGVSYYKTSSAGRHIIDLATPILFQSTKVGEVHLGVSDKSIITFSNELMYSLLIMTCLSILMAGLTAYALTKQVKNAIAIIQKAINEIRGEHFNYRIDIKRSDEFGKTFSDFDLLAEKFQILNENKNANE